jgi:uncharacterized membrane protein
MRIAFPLACLCLMIAHLSPTHAQTTDPCQVTGALGGTFTEIAVPGATETHAAAINNRGQIVGTFTDAIGSGSFLLERGAYSQLSLPDAESVRATDINNAGVIVGGFFASGFHGFVLNGSTLTQLDVPGAVATSALGINERGTVVGVYLTPNGEDGIEHGFIYDNGVYATVDYPGASQTNLRDIDNTGVAVGGGFVAPALINFVYQDGRFTVLPECASGLTWDSFARPHKLVGTLQTGPNETQGVVMTAHGLATVAHPASELSIVTGGNASGWLVGQYHDPSVGLRSFLLTPKH